MNRINIRIYIILIIILLILSTLILVLSSKKNKEKNQTVVFIPTPTLVHVFPTASTNQQGKIIITPKFTGANIAVPQPVLNFAIQKQALKNKTPLTENGFSITYDFGSDMFVVTSSSSQPINKTVFEQWLKQNYSLIPLTKFTFK